MEKDKRNHEEKEVTLIRILGKDLPGDKKLLVGLTKIKGISWAFASAICKILGLDKNKQIQDLETEETEKLEEFVKNPKIPAFLKNRQKDFDGGEDLHLQGSDLDLRKEFDVKRLKKIRSYRGNRHALKLPVRGQRTKSNFRRNRKKSGAVGVKKK
ncbi:30S ribosomal protein S13 [archaeon]|jgi:small subunit ribosomal protein S13|nr:30S ribosomal protein S13 [archaeon]MBT3577868.1 30S ribosomal protein S13 [archaeon]MBT6819768.1 30S ribosomal protein S13 [archaeon]MBT6956450.1 30S ribosomal protein S13 [archaeon]MBT7025550.1 30S ribosomal protein S13 [archaeon]